MNLYLVRHGQSVANDRGIIQGHKDFPLSELGQNQARLLGEFLESQSFDYIYSSHLTRAHETAKAISAHQPLDVIKWERICEINLGPLEGKTRQEIYLQYPELKAESKSILTTGIVGTETVEEITDRCHQVLEELLSGHKRHNVILVSHGGFISIFLMYLMYGHKWHQAHRPFVIGNTGVSRIEFLDDGKPIFHYINSDAHLLLANMQRESELF
ncbi:histidine phosphatase family protein [Anaerobacillus arseniciselenatis]|uniref:Histidine phosphatase family protein n=1 Tax=Anaerobacillus arseniciselenatis TaxID=85682 RepID=A0A1S2LNJ6_9BACI|nr:histidine phosphatase family protein [Anaerobacillus arseniciselenatis]OIJ14109.1 histidine phosphatase family protein [Anaerobacillus arseniciselenatis]